MLIICKVIGICTVVFSLKLRLSPTLAESLTGMLAEYCGGRRGVKAALFSEHKTYLRVEKHTASLNTGHKKALWVMPERLAYSVVVSMFDRLFM